MKILFAFLLLAVGGFATAHGQEAEPAAAAAKAAPKGIELYSLTYDEEHDIFSDPKTNVPYSGPVFSKYGDGTMELEGTLKDGREEGVWIQYYEDGKKEFQGAYIGGLETGEWIYWHENGQLMSKGGYKNGSTAGQWFTYFDTGKPETEGLYVDGLMDGPWKFFDEKTGEASVVQFERGIQLKR